MDDDDGIAVKIVKLVKKANSTNGIGVTIKRDSKGRSDIHTVFDCYSSVKSTEW